MLYISSYLMLMPMAVVVFYIWLLAAYMFMKRKKAVTEGRISAKYFKTYNSLDVPHDVVLLGRHFDNQFQVPPLFLVTATLLIFFEAVSYFSLFVAWLFVAFRLVHSYIHLGANHILRRAGVYAASWICVLVLWVLLFIKVLSS